MDGPSPEPPQAQADCQTCAEFAPAAADCLCSELAASRPPRSAARLGALLSELQGAMLERLERFVMYFLSAPPVDLEALGRSADKFRDLFDRAGRLPLRCGAPVEPLLRDLVQDLNPYSRLRGPAESPTVRDEEPEAANALVASWAPAGAVQVASHGDQSPRSSLKPAADASCKPVRASRRIGPDHMCVREP